MASLLQLARLQVDSGDEKAKQLGVAIAEAAQQLTLYLQASVQNKDEAMEQQKEK